MTESFKILVPHGGNSLSEVHLGVRRAGNVLDECVIYTLHPKLAEVGAITQGLMSSAVTSQRLKHPNLSTVHEVGTFQNRPTAVAEYFQGIDMKTLHKKCGDAQIPLSVPMATYIGAQMARALSYLHGHGAAGRRDGPTLLVNCILPATVLVSVEGDVKFAGHALSGACLPALRAYPEDALSDARRYMAPEFLAKGEASSAADLFSLGIFLWELLTTRRYSGEPLRDIDFPEELRKIVADLTSTRVETRATNAAEVEKRLTAFLNASFPKFIPRHLGAFVSSLFSAELKAASEEITAGIARADLWSSAGSSPGGKPVMDIAGEPKDEQQVTFKKGLTLEMDNSAKSSLELKEQPANKGSVRWDAIVKAPARPASGGRPSRQRPSAQSSSMLVPIVLLAVAAVVVIILFARR